MEKLQKRSDGFYETPSGLLGVKPKRYLLETASYRQFSFKVHPVEPSVVVRWRKEDQIAVIDDDVAKSMLSLGYAEHVTEALADLWNAKVEELQSDAQEPEGNPAAEGEPPVVEAELKGEQTQSTASEAQEQAPTPEPDAAEQTTEEGTQTASEEAPASEEEKVAEPEDEKPAKAKKGSLV